jgi:hypothetical protein
MPDGTTPGLSLILPEIGGSASTWGNKLNTNFTAIDAAIVGDRAALAAPTGATLVGTTQGNVESRFGIVDANIDTLTNAVISGTPPDIFAVPTPPEASRITALLLNGTDPDEDYYVRFFYRDDLVQDVVRFYIEIRRVSDDAVVASLVSYPTFLDSTGWFGTRYFDLIEVGGSGITGILGVDFGADDTERWGIYSGTPANMLLAPQNNIFTLPSFTSAVISVIQSYNQNAGTTGIFVNQASANAAERAVMDRIRMLRITGGDPAKFYAMGDVFWKDFGTRFRFDIYEANDSSGTGATLVASLFVNDAGSWNTVREIVVPEDGGSGIGAVVTMDFTDPTALAAYTNGDPVSVFNRRLLAPSVLESTAPGTIQEILDAIPLKRSVSNTSGFLFGGPSTIASSVTVGVGFGAFDSLTTGNGVAVGHDAGRNVTTQTHMVLVGEGAGFNQSGGTAGDTTFVGRWAGYGVNGAYTGSGGNTGIGTYSLGHLTTGAFNTALGRASGWYHRTANSNVSLGYRCGYSLNAGTLNLFAGFYSCHEQHHGSRNTWLGAYTDGVIPDSTGMTATPATGAGLAPGTYGYRVTFVIDGVESALSLALPSNVVVTAGNGIVNLAGIPTYSGPRNCTARRIYRTRANQESELLRVAIIADNTTTTFADNVPDAALGPLPDALNDTILLGAYARAMKPNQMVIGSTFSRITEIIGGGGADDNAPLALTFSASNRVGTNGAGADLRLRGGLGTGNATGGRVILAASPPGGSGFAANPATDWFSLDGRGFYTLRETAAANVPTPASGTINLFIEGGDLKFRRSDGTVRTVTTS